MSEANLHDGYFAVNNDKKATKEKDGLHFEDAAPEGVLNKGSQDLNAVKDAAKDNDIKLIVHVVRGKVTDAHKLDGKGEWHQTDEHNDKEIDDL